MPEVSGSAPSIDFTPIALQPGARIANRFEILAIIGRGPSALVYRALDHADRVEVALKILAPRLSYDRELYLRLFRELKTTTEIFHPQFVNVRNVDEWNGTTFLAMELVPGKPLKQDVDRRGSMPRSQALKIAYEVAVALRALHKEHLSHRSVWPRNVLIDPALAIKVMDFAGSRARAILGKEGLDEQAAYLSPEECDPRLHGDSRADVYNLGIMLFELLTGRSPFPLTLTAAELREHRRPDPPALRTLVPDCPEWIEQMVRKALALQAAERHESIEAFLAELEATATEAAISEDVEAVIRDIERKKQARAEREAAFAREPLPPLVLPSPEAKRRARVNLRDFSPAQIARRQKTGLIIAAMVAGAILLAFLLSLLTKPRSSAPPTSHGPESQAKLSTAEKARADIEGFKDSYPGDDEGYLKDLVAMGTSALDTLHAHASDPNPVARMYVARALGQIDADSSREDLEKLARDGDVGVRKAALSGLKNVTAPIASETVESALSSREGEEQVLGLDLVTAGKTTVGASALTPLLSSPDDAVRARAVRALGSLKGTDIPPLLAKGLSDSNPRVREEAARGFAAFASEEVALQLVPALQDVAPGVARAAAASLAVSLSPPLKASLGAEAGRGVPKNEGLYLVAALVRAGHTDLRDMVRGRLAADDPAARQFASKVAVIAEDKDAFLLVETALARRRTRYAQRPLLLALVQLGNQRALDRAFAAMAAPGELRQRFAMQLLAESGNEKAVPVLEKALAAQSSEESRLPYLLALARLHSIPPDEDEMLASDNREGRRRAALVYASAGDTGKTGRILQIRAAEQDHEQALPFDVALGLLWHRPTLDKFREEALTADPVTRERTARFFATVARPELLPGALPLLSDARPEVRAQASVAVGAMGDARALAAVKQLLSDPDAAVREAAALAAYQLGDEAIIDTLALDLKSGRPDTRAEGCRKLGRMRSPLAAPLLVPLLSDTARLSVPPMRREKGTVKPGKDEIYARVVDDAMAALEAITGFRSGYDPWALDEDQALALEKMRAHLQAHMAELQASELL